ncbi:MULTISPECIES: capsular polysaccharide synthesis protein [unclassified Microbacterium]|uniref:capsular polysaccharide synthesis protein n=1 Tax=unclassified Microbacterium TaxID=2609290 RepID=UPI00214CFE64|nr:MULTISPECIES: capsular polysaccharide synthesis protein [unclassified Microbacterium]MCR2811069.1 capsular polysaccharide synthesis protein [Microbacterium sp. zg.B185]WIM20814.1 capsular polysaccharide synthesis protein [Microbacterium sp. zg-B185]
MADLDRTGAGEDGAPSSFLAGLAAQLARVEKFKDILDPAAVRRGSRLVTEFFRERRDALRHAAGLPAGPGSSALGRRLAAQDLARSRDVPLAVYSYWNTGAHDAPDIVRACTAQLQRMHPGVRLLDAVSVRELIDIPSRIHTVLERDRPAHFADYVRSALLDRYGGIWVDATCWVPRPLGEVIRPLLSGGVLYPRWATGQIGNWFIAAVPGSLVIRLQRAALEMWWAERDDLPDYFLYHRIFEALRALIPEFRGQWSEAGHLSSASSHVLQLSMMEPWSADVAGVIDQISIVQKLSYKYDPASVPAGSILQHLLTTRRLT